MTLAEMNNEFVKQETKSKSNEVLINTHFIAFYIAKKNMAR